MSVLQPEQSPKWCWLTLLIDLRRIDQAAFRRDAHVAARTLDTSRRTLLILSRESSEPDGGQQMGASFVLSRSSIISMSMLRKRSW